MVDWDRVEELRSKGWGWEQIAADPKVGFHADTSAGDPGRALRAMYHRGRVRERKKTAKTPGGKGTDSKVGSPGWSLLRVFYLIVPLTGIWLALAYLVPSPIGLVLPAFPYLGLVFAALAIVLIWMLWRSTRGPRWSKVYRNTVVGGVVLGFVVAGLIGLTGAIAFGCPFLPPASSLTTVSTSGWEKVPTSSWQSNGKPVLYFYGASWCPFCSASSWALWKALSEFGAVSGEYTGQSSTSDSFPGTPEMVLAGSQVSAKGAYATPIVFQVSEDTSGVKDTYPSTSSCFQQAYYTAYASGIPFVVLDGQYVHLGTLVDPSNLQNWANGANGGPASVNTSVIGEMAVTGGNPWLSIQDAAWWVMALLTVASGVPLTTLKNDFGWSAATQTAVAADISNM